MHPQKATQQETSAEVDLEAVEDQVVYSATEAWERVAAGIVARVQDVVMLEGDAGQEAQIQGQPTVETPVEMEVEVAEE